MIDTQRKRIARFIVVVSGAVGAAGLMAGCTQQAAPTAAETAAAAQAASPYKPTATFQDIMDTFVDPAGDAIWQSVTTTVDAKGIHEKRPTTDADWHALRRHAITLVEAANLISIPGRRVANGNKTLEDMGDLDVAHVQQRLDTKHDQLVAFAGALRDIGLKLVDAAERKDVDAITQHGGTLDEVCEDCHKVFWYPDDSTPPPATREGPAEAAAEKAAAGK